MQMPTASRAAGGMAERVGRRFDAHFPNRASVDDLVSDEIERRSATRRALELSSRGSNVDMVDHGAAAGADRPELWGCV